jgi:hypothetical protein
MATHVKIIAVVFVLTAVMFVFLALFGSLAFGLMGFLIGTQADHSAALPAAIIGLAGSMLMLVLLGFALLSFICGWGLWKFRPWARVMAIILAAIGLTKFPVGTLFGVYALAILFRKDTEALFVSPRA